MSKKHYPDIPGPDLQKLLDREHGIVTAARARSADPWDDWYDVGIRIGLETFARRVQQQRNERRGLMKAHCRPSRARRKHRRTGGLRTT